MIIYVDDENAEKIDKESLTGRLQGEYSAGNLGSWCKPCDIHRNGDEDEHRDHGGGDDGGNGYGEDGEGGATGIVQEI